MNEIDVYRPRAEVAVPAAMDTDSWTVVLTEVATLASRICDTPFVPDGLRGSAPAVAAAILAGRELGLGPMTSLANIHVIKGKPTLSAALMRALILAQGHQIETVDISDTRAVVRGRRKGEANWEEAAFTADHAKRAGIQLGGYPQDKLYARATTRLARRKFADVIAGMPYSTEEAEDGQPGDVLLPGEADGKPLAAHAAAPRTAQRKTRQVNTTTGEVVPPASPPPAGRAHGEEDPTTSGASSSAHAPDSGSPARTAGPSPSSSDGSGSEPVTNRQLTAIWTVLTREFGFADTDGDKDAARVACGLIIRRDITSTTQLTKREAGTIIDTLARWQHQASQEGGHPRDWMNAGLTAAEEARAQDAAEREDGEVTGGE